MLSSGNSSNPRSLSAIRRRLQAKRQTPAHPDRKRSHCSQRIPDTSRTLPSLLLARSCLIRPGWVRFPSFLQAPDHRGANRFPISASGRSCAGAQSPGLVAGRFQTQRTSAPTPPHFDGLVAFDPNGRSRPQTPGGSAASPPKFSPTGWRRAGDAPDRSYRPQPAHPKSVSTMLRSVESVS